MPAAALSVPLSALALVAFKYSTAQICALWSLAQICVLWPPHKYVYFGHLTNMCTLATSTLPLSAQISVLRPLNVNGWPCHNCNADVMFTDHSLYNSFYLITHISRWICEIFPSYATYLRHTYQTRLSQSMKEWRTAKCNLSSKNSFVTSFSQSGYISEFINKTLGQKLKVANRRTRQQCIG
jgi:hypothetical protein